VLGQVLAVPVLVRAVQVLAQAATAAATVAAVTVAAQGNRLHCFEPRFVCETQIRAVTGRDGRCPSLLIR
jgi:hypothetical protein